METQNKQWGRKYLEVTKDLDNYVVCGNSPCKIALMSPIAVLGGLPKPLLVSVIH